MIRKFSVPYVGQIDLDHVGKDGTPADQRRYPDERIAGAYRSMVDVARVLDDEGYYCLWTAEHHFRREGYEVLPNLILVDTYLAAVTRQLKLDRAFNIFPMWHPIRLAEDNAVADILTGGRVIMGIGRGNTKPLSRTFPPGGGFTAPRLPRGASRAAWSLSPRATRSG
jgi:alkanesulfonate monooxygenase SsuD/methylene tetrahydromethanopterin reductase-like flavin-dependent oxidoreductase (luciferase family)